MALCIDHQSQPPTYRETGYSNVLGGSKDVCKFSEKFTIFHTKKYFCLPEAVFGFEIISFALFSALNLDQADVFWQWKRLEHDDQIWIIVSDRLLLKILAVPYLL